MSINILQWRRRPSRRLAIWSAVLALTILAQPLALPAQRLPERRFAGFDRGAPARLAAPLPAADGEEADPFGVGAAALLGGVAGGAAGGLIGYYLSGGSRLCGDDNCGLFGGLLGVLVGEPLGMGIAAHVANGRRGNAVLDVLGAAGTGYLLLAGASGTTRSGATIAAVAAVQIGVTVAIERSTGRTRSP